MSIAAVLHPHYLKADVGQCRRLVAPGEAGLFAIVLPTGTLAVAIVLGVVVLGVAGFLLVRRFSKSRRSRSPHRAASQRSASVVASGGKPRLQTSLSNLGGGDSQGKVNGTNGHHSSRRKKVFDYNRYFTDLMSAVSNSSIIEPVAGESPRASETLVLAPESVERLSSASINLRNAQTEILASQKVLIEEQKRLILEQSRLIEEKSKLISEKNQLLKMQSEWIDSKVL
jgi:hypothetical protein